jgi:hypothetical protein
MLASRATLATPKSDSEILLKASLPFAEKMLREHGGFLPYAYSMQADRTIAMVGGYDGQERPAPADILALIKGVLKSFAATHKIIASAVVSDAFFTDPRTGVRSDAISVALDHKDSFSVIVVYRYRVEKDGLHLEPPIAQKGNADIFVQ